jgi:hypothetical protein
MQLGCLNLPVVKGESALLFRRFQASRLPYGRPKPHISSARRSDVGSGVDGWEEFTERLIWW